MSAREVAVVRRLYLGLSGLARLFDPAFERVAEECLAPNYEFAFARPGGIGLDERYRGLQGLRDAMDGWLEHWETWETVAEDFVDLGDRVLVLSRSRGRSPSGLEVNEETAELHELVDARITRTLSFPTRREALELLGLA